ncbi:MAG: hypothetical protein Q8M11_21400 [Sulfuritalea sp.]|nr:hypothetical protein [Sulfuritalea sp.]MDP1983583.1 hypothetical protein [Sulfuritalea sp.]
MTMTYVVTIGFIFMILITGIGIERLYRRFAANNPQLGPFRDTDKCGCCSGGSSCSDESCASDNPQPDSATRH